MPRRPAASRARRAPGARRNELPTSIGNAGKPDAGRPGQQTGIVVYRMGAVAGSIWYLTMRAISPAGSRAIMPDGPCAAGIGDFSSMMTAR